jgi:hypothetical protein
MNDAIRPLVQAAVAAAIAEEGWTANDTESIAVFEDGTWVYIRKGVSYQSGRWDRDPDAVHGIYVHVNPDSNPLDRVCGYRVWPYTEYNICLRLPHKKGPHKDARGREFDHAGYGA